MWDAWVAAAETSDPDAPELREYTDGEALTLIVGALYANRERGIVAKGHVVLDPRVTEVKPAAAPTEVYIEDCASDENWLEYKTDGDLVNDVPGGRHRTTATVTLVDEQWKVTLLLAEGIGTC